MTTQSKAWEILKEYDAIKYKIIRDIGKLFESENEEDDYYIPVRVGNFRSNSYIDYENNVIEIIRYQLKSILIKIKHT